MPGTIITLRSVETGIEQTAETNDAGFYAFTTLRLGHYESEVTRDGLRPYKRIGITIDLGSALQADVVLELGEQSQQIMVSDTQTHVDTESTQMGEVVTGVVIIAVALNGRSYTDLLALQPGVVPMSTQQPDSIVMAGASVAIAPSGGLNPGNQSISGQREDANGFQINGSDANLVATYEYQLPLDRLFSGRGKALTGGWALSGITRLSSGFPVAISSDGDRSLMGSLPNGVNNKSLDLPDFTPGPLNLNSNPRNRRPYFNISLFSPNALGTPGNASRRSFHGPGMFNSDIALVKFFQLSESKALQFRLESFITFNHTQFFGPVAVNGDRDRATFGEVVKASAPRLMQLALKFTF